MPDHFVVENAVPGGGFVIPTKIAFLPGGRMLVAEKGGKVWTVTHGIMSPEPLWDGSQEVLNEGDRGLLSIAVDPAYLTNHYIYMLYTVDPDSNGVDTSDEAFGRLTRYTVSFTDSNVVDASSRRVLMGAVWSDGPPVGSNTHTIGDLAWGADGSLLVSAGDGANGYPADGGGMDPALFAPGRTNPLEDIGAFRSQYIGSLAGKILRLDPATGHGYPSNPYWNGNPTSAQSRVWCYGLRNPFRFTVRPGTGSSDPAAGNPGTLWIGDVGWATWEEHNLAPQGGLNFGWPCHEGPLPVVEYQILHPAHHGCASIGVGDNIGPLTGPAASFNHYQGSLSLPPGAVGNTAIGGEFYAGSTYPAFYRGRYFFADFGTGWIRTSAVDASGGMGPSVEFATDAEGPVDLCLEPVSGDLFYVAIFTGEVRRIRWTGPVAGTNPPVPMASALPRSGNVPLTVAFSSAGTYDPDLDPLTLSWNFGDGSGSSDPAPSHTYVTGGVYAAVLIADDGRGGIARDTVTITAHGGAGPFPTTPVLDNFDRLPAAIGDPWTGILKGAFIRNRAASTLCCDIEAIWGGTVFGPDQEAYFTFATLQPEGQALLLKVQGADRASGCIEVSYDPRTALARVTTFAPFEPPRDRGGIPCDLKNGDQLGARVWSDGQIQIYKNGTLVGVTSTGPWPFNEAGGRIGFRLEAALPARIDDFGGGNIVMNTAPTATILAPLDRSFYVETHVLTMLGSGRDIEQPSATLSYAWQMNLHHNNHVHPGSFVATGPNASYEIPRHADQTGVWYEIELRVTDSGGLSDTARVTIYPEVDLVPGAIVVDSKPGTSQPVGFHFSITNIGRVVSRTSRWRLIADETLLDEGDVTVRGWSTVSISSTIQPVLPPGDHTLRLVVDTLGVVVETNETNNAVTQQLTIEGLRAVAGGEQGLPKTLALSNAYPSPSDGRVSLRLDLPRAARVTFSVHDLQGRRVWGGAERRYEAGRWVLDWAGGQEGGARVPSGVYLARISVDGRTFVRRISRVN
ncbi:MAG TPA: PQQ-dependent sugar dehydrogenase [Candidatus Eisenbacteria bacterium]|nr:PQQ-dependent sugar dehydrogenase [Candidatus Eisenbacteria bacterium]